MTEQPARQVRERSLDAAQKRELARGVPLVLPSLFPAPPCWETVFQNDHPLELEIGCGRPHFLYERAAEAPERNIVGIDWKGRWIRQANARKKRDGLQNLCAIHGNAWFLVGALFAPEQLERVYLNFPDPWWKSRHQKRRIINDAFAHVVTSRLRKGGIFHIQTDVASLLEEELEHLEAVPGLKNPWGRGRLCPRKLTAARSHREKKCRADGVPVFRAVLERV